ncbi:MAG TPA: nuclear transport factor 2 family protein [Candidatus Acidoferrales bacterium]|nr:nuclear transport factor 2 family protein [Candidatus Acidoferrales bacterium]
MPIAIGILCLPFFVATPVPSAFTAGDEQSLLQADHAAFESDSPSPVLNDSLLDNNFTWTDSSGNTRNKSEILEAIRSKKKLVAEKGIVVAHAYRRVGIIQENAEKVYTLRIWIKRDGGWHLLIYQAVTIGAPPSAAADNEICENPCNTVPFHPRNNDERDVIQTYQTVERAVTAHDSAAWGSHIADEFFAVTSNSNRPLDKATRMAGLDNQKVGGIAPFPLVSAHMFAFGETMIMTSRQQPLHGLPLHVTRVWFKRNNTWVEAYSYQTTIQADVFPR